MNAREIATELYLLRLKEKDLINGLVALCPGTDMKDIWKQDPEGIPPFPFITNPLPRIEQFDKINEELREWIADFFDKEKGAIEFQDLHHAIVTYERTHFTPEEIMAARKAVIAKNTARGYYA